jgi:hypothetical protein
MTVVQGVADDYADALAALPPPLRASEQAQAIRWMIEELRVSLFAQTLGTPAPVSERRVRTLINALLRRCGRGVCRSAGLAAGLAAGGRHGGISSARHPR